MTENNFNEVVVILPFIGDKLLMQLRDFNPNINFPGHWGYFSGSLQKDEVPVEAAKRELFEEIGYFPNEIVDLGCLCVSDHNNLMAHLYWCSIQVPLKELVLNEGLDMALVSPEEILSKRIYSKALEKIFPVARTSIIQDALTLALASKK